MSASAEFGRVSLDTAPPPATRYECKVCWHVYDPAEGDPVWQIAPGTPFADLPAHWSCPNCTAEKTGFLAVRD